MVRAHLAGGGLLGVLAATWIGCLGGLFIGALGQTEMLQPGGYYADGIVYGFLGGAAAGGLVGLAAGTVLAQRWGDGRVALVGGVLGGIGAAVYGRAAFALADAVESAYLNDPAIAGLLAAIVFGAVGGVLAAAIRGCTPPRGSAAPAEGKVIATADLISGGILGAFLGMFSGAYIEGATTAWATTFGALTAGSNVALLFGFYLGAAVGAIVATVVGALLRRGASSA